MRDTSGHTRYRPLWSVGRRLNSRGHWQAAHRVERLLRLLYGCDIPTGTDLRSVVLMHNALGVVIHQRTTFLGRAVVFQNVTIGDSGTPSHDGRVAPEIGDRVFIGAGAAIIGPVNVGDDCIIGAGAVVTCNVPDGHRAVGNPATVVALTSRAVLDDWFGP